MKLLYSFAYLLIFSLVLISCDCADDLDTPKVHVPSEFAQINVINIGKETLNLEYNNIELGKYKPKSSFIEYAKIESGTPILDISSIEQNNKLYSIPLSLEQNKYYSALILNDTRYRVLIYQDEYKEIGGENFLIRIINLSAGELAYYFSGNTNTLTEYGTQEILASPDDYIKINDEEINLSELSSGRIYNFILNTDQDIFISQSFQK